MAQTFLISGFDVGWENDLDPWLLTEKAFPVLEDAIVFRGRVERRLGYSLQGRLRRVISGTVLAQTTAVGVVTTIADLLADGAIALRATEPNGEISPGSVVVTSGANIWNDATTVGVMTGAGGNAADGTIDYVTGQIVLNFSIADPGGVAITVDFNYFPSLPVMGLRTRELINVNEEQTIAFDTKYAYRFVSTAWEELPSVAVTTWGGTNSQFFWTTNYRGALSSSQLFWATNYNGGVGSDPIRYYDGVTWTSFTPTTNGANTLTRAKIIFPFKDRLVVMHTFEGGAEYPQRCRFSQNGNPTDAANSWRDDVVGRGGYIDAPTSEVIISAQFVKDRVIVFFESSTWELVYIGNAALPFVWQKINTEIGAESPFSQVPFDDGVIGIGDTGIHIANSNGVARIDEKIPDEVTVISNLNQGVSRVYGIRNFIHEVVYWAITDYTENSTFPNKVLVYNYRNNTFSIFNDRFTCFGYFQSITGITWADLTDRTWASWSAPWSSGITQAFAKQILAGNQQGFTLIFNETVVNGQSLSVTGITTPAAPSNSTITSPNHNLPNGTYIIFNDMTGITITPLGHTTDTFRILTSTTNDFTIDGRASGTYPGGGTITVLNNINITTKEFDFETKQDKKNSLKRSSFLFDKTEDGEISLDIYLNSDVSVPIEPLIGSKTINTRPEDNNTFQQSQNKIWHTVMRHVIGDSYQFRLTFDDAQMRTPSIQQADVVLHAILLEVEPVGRL